MQSGQWVVIDKDLLICPIDANLNLFNNPVITPLGHTYSRANLDRWIEQKRGEHQQNLDRPAMLVIHDPLAGVPLNPDSVRPNLLVARLLQHAQVGKTQIKIDRSLLRNLAGHYFENPVIINENGETAEAKEIKAYPNRAIGRVIEQVKKEEKKPTREQRLLLPHNRVLSDDIDPQEEGAGESEFVVALEIEDNPLPVPPALPAHQNKKKKYIIVGSLLVIGSVAAALTAVFANKPGHSSSSSSLPSVLTDLRYNFEPYIRYDNSDLSILIRICNYSNKEYNYYTTLLLRFLNDQSQQHYNINNFYRPNSCLPELIISNMFENQRVGSMFHGPLPLVPHFSWRKLPVIISHLAEDGKPELPDVLVEDYMTVACRNNETICNQSQDEIAFALDVTKPTDLGQLSRLIPSKSTRRNYAISDFYDPRIKKFYYPISVNVNNDNIFHLVDRMDSATITLLQNIIYDHRDKMALLKLGGLTDFLPEQIDSVANQLIDAAMQSGFGLMINLEDAPSYERIRAVLSLIQKLREIATQKSPQEKIHLSIRIPGDFFQRFKMRLNPWDIEAIAAFVDSISVSTILDQYALNNHRMSYYQSPLVHKQHSDDQSIEQTLRDLDFSFNPKLLGLTIYTDGQQIAVPSLGQYHGVWADSSTLEDYLCYDSIAAGNLPQGTVCFDSDENPNGNIEVAPLCYREGNQTEPNLFITYVDPIAAKAITAFAKDNSLGEIGLSTQSGKPCEAKPLRDAIFDELNKNTTQVSSQSWAGFFNQRFRSFANRFSKETSFSKQRASLMKRFPEDYKQISDALLQLEASLKKINADNNELVVEDIFNKITEEFKKAGVNRVKKVKLFLLSEQKSTKAVDDYLNGKLEQPVDQQDFEKQKNSGLIHESVTGQLLLGSQAKLTVLPRVLGLS